MDGFINAMLFCRVKDMRADDQLQTRFPEPAHASEDFISVALDGATAMVRTSRHLAAGEGERVGLACGSAALHLFDEAGLRIGRAG